MSSDSMEYLEEEYLEEESVETAAEETRKNIESLATSIKDYLTSLKNEIPVDVSEKFKIANKHYFVLAKLENIKKRLNQAYKVYFEDSETRDVEILVQRGDAIIEELYKTKGRFMLETMGPILLQDDKYVVKTEEDILELAQSLSEFCHKVQQRGIDRTDLKTMKSAVNLFELEFKKDLPRIKRTIENITYDNYSINEVLEGFKYLDSVWKDAKEYSTKFFAHVSWLPHEDLQKLKSLEESVSDIDLTKPLIRYAHNMYRQKLEAVSNSIHGIQDSSGYVRFLTNLEGLRICLEEIYIYDKGGCTMMKKPQTPFLGNLTPDVGVLARLYAEEGESIQQTMKYMLGNLRTAYGFDEMRNSYGMEVKNHVDVCSWTNSSLLTNLNTVVSLKFPPGEKPITLADLYELAELKLKLLKEMEAVGEELIKYEKCEYIFGDPSINIASVLEGNAHDDSYKELLSTTLFTKNANDVQNQGTTSKATGAPTTFVCKPSTFRSRIATESPFPLQPITKVLSPRIVSPGSEITTPFWTTHSLDDVIDNLNLSQETQSPTERTSTEKAKTSAEVEIVQSATVESPPPEYQMSKNMIDSMDSPKFYRQRENLFDDDRE